jgi:hypothetical protein
MLFQQGRCKGPLCRRGVLVFGGNELVFGLLSWPLSPAPFVRPPSPCRRVGNDLCGRRTDSVSGGLVSAAAGVNRGAAGVNRGKLFRRHDLSARERRGRETPEEINRYVPLRLTCRWQAEVIISRSVFSYSVDHRNSSSVFW